MTFGFPHCRSQPPRKRSSRTLKTGESQSFERHEEARELVQGCRFTLVVEFRTLACGGVATGNCPFALRESLLRPGLEAHNGRRMPQWLHDSTVTELIIYVQQLVDS